MTAPALHPTFAQARDHEALAQRLVADVYRRPGRLDEMARHHVGALSDLPDVALAWWLNRTWFMLARREVPHLRSPTSATMAHARVSTALIKAFQNGPALTALRAELIQVLVSQHFPFISLVEPVAGLDEPTQLVAVEWELATCETSLGKAVVFERWLELLEGLRLPLVAVAVQRLLDREQFWDTRHLAHKDAQALLPWAAAPGWSLAELPAQVRARLPAAVWGVLAPLAAASFPEGPDLTEVSARLQVPLMVPLSG